MKTVTVHRSSDSKEEDACVLVIGESIATVTTSPTTGEIISLSAMAHLVNYEADAIANLLFDTLPQAVAARVMVRLMERFSTNFLGGPKR